MKVMITAIIVVQIVFGQLINWNANNITITTEAELREFARRVNGTDGFAANSFQGKTVKLGNDINLTSSWMPIGNYLIPERNFAGIFDGNEKKISNVDVSDNSVYAGLFGYVKEGGQIKNLTVNVNEIKTGFKDKVYAGGLAAYYASEKPIVNCRVNIRDSICANAYSGSLIDTVIGNSGGLAGGGGGKNTLTISNCYVTGNVSSSSNSFSYSGGLVGKADNTLTISNCYATGQVHSNSNSSSGFQFSYSGGLVGKADNTLTISNCYTMGDISAISEGHNSSFNRIKSFSGGLVGSADNTPTISNCYKTGSVSSASFNTYNPSYSYSYSGGILGESASGTNTSVYYDNWEVSGAVGNGDATGIVGVSPVELRRQTTFVDWDFVNTWGINPEINDGFPYLLWSIPGDDTPICNIKESADKYGILLSSNIVSQKAEMRMVTPSGDRILQVRAVVYDNVGNVVFDKTETGDKITWDLTNNAGRNVANGTYLVIADVKSSNKKIYRYSAKIGVKK
jgi:hypothetical protein